MGEIAPATVKINDVEVAGEAALSAAFFTKLGAAVNNSINEQDGGFADSMQQQITNNDNDIAVNLANNITQTTDIASNLTKILALSPGPINSTSVASKVGVGDRVLISPLLGGAPLKFFFAVFNFTQDTLDEFDSEQVFTVGDNIIFYFDGSDRSIKHRIITWQ